MIEISEQIVNQVDSIVATYPRKESALLPILSIFQKKDGYIKAEIVDWIALKLGLTPIQVYEVATFYPIFRTLPVGKNLVKVCCSLGCKLQNGPEVFKLLQKGLECPEAGGTSQDGRFTIEKCGCLSNCHKGPNVLVNHTLYESISPTKVKAFVDQLKQECN